MPHPAVVASCSWAELQRCLDDVLSAHREALENTLAKALEKHAANPCQIEQGVAKCGFQRQHAVLSQGTAADNAEEQHGESCQGTASAGEAGMRHEQDGLAKAPVCTMGSASDLSEGSRSQQTVKWAAMPRKSSKLAQSYAKFALHWKDTPANTGEDKHTTQSQSAQGTKYRRSSTRQKSSFGKLLANKQRRPSTSLKAFVAGRLDAFVGMIVLLNLALMIVQIQFAGEAATKALESGQYLRWSEADTFFDVSEHVFFFVYLFDLLFRLVVLRSKWLFDPSEGFMYMNIVDLMVVLANAFELALFPMLGDADLERNASNVKVLKVLRVSRAFRLIRTIRIFHPLRVLCATCLASMGAFFWSILLLFMFQIIYAFVLSQALHGFIINASNDYDARVWVHQRYGDFFKSLYSMFEITYSGSWPSHARPVIEQVSPVYAPLFLIYVTFVVFAVVRVITALFIKATLACAANDASIAMEEKRLAAASYRMKLEELFDAIDLDGDETVSQEEFQAALNNPIVYEYMSLLDMGVNDVAPLFSLLNDTDNVVDVNEFCNGITNLKGQARALEVVLMQHENYKIRDQCREISAKVDILADHVGCDAASLLPPMRKSASDAVRFTVSPRPSRSGNAAV